MRLFPLIWQVFWQVLTTYLLRKCSCIDFTSFFLSHSNFISRVFSVIKFLFSTIFSMAVSLILTSFSRNCSVNYDLFFGILINAKPKTWLEWNLSLLYLCWHENSFQIIPHKVPKRVKNHQMLEVGKIWERPVAEDCTSDHEIFSPDR